MYRAANRFACLGFVLYLLPVIVFGVYERLGERLAPALLVGVFCMVVALWLYGRANREG
jgi:thiol:disulfide interchange protein